MREKVLILAKEEGCPFDKGLIQRRFLHAISTGLRNNNIWNDLRPTLENNKTSDEHIYYKLFRKLLLNDSERHEKPSKEKKEAKVNKIDNADNPLLNEIKAMKLKLYLLLFVLIFFKWKKLWIREKIFAENVSYDALIVLLLNLIVCTVLCMALLNTKSLCVFTMIKKTSQLPKQGMQQLYVIRPHVIYVVSKKNIKILYKCRGRNNGRLLARAGRNIVLAGRFVLRKTYFSQTF